MFTVTGSPSQAFVDALSATLQADSVLMGLVTGVFAHVSEKARTNFPYVVLGRRTGDGNGGAMQMPGGQYTVQIDVWSEDKGPFVTSTILSRIFTLLERQPLRVSGFELIRGSLTRTEDEIFTEPDTDDPKQVLYHGVQVWTGEIHESI